MADIKNTFLKSKMNKDLDARLVSNGEYRDAQNINVNKSEGPDVGAIENIIGNSLVTNFNLANINLEVIGCFFDNINEKIYAFVTNYTDSSTDQLSNNCASYSSYNTTTNQGVCCAVICYSYTSNEYQFLVFGSWLNFSKTHPILGINLIENQLFWTDNRNQPRKINVDRAIETPYILTNNGYVSESNPYYQNEDQISVAKYYPYKPLELITKGALTACLNTSAGVFTIGTEYDVTAGNGSGGKVMAVTSTGQMIITAVGEGYDLNFQQTINGVVYIFTAAGVGTMKDAVSRDLPQTESFTVTTPGAYAAAAPITISGTPSVNYLGAFIRIIDQPGFASSAPDNTQVIGTSSNTVKLSKAVTLGSGATIVIGANPDYDPNYKGDEDVLREDFVKFAYRLKFADNEYSLISPFSQPCFIPTQNGYFKGDDFIKTYESTIVKHMENLVNKITFSIPGPDKIDGTQMNWGSALNLMHVDSIELLWKNASGTNIRVLDSIPSTDLSGKFTSTNYYTYTYEAKKPIRSLPEFETTRTSDKVPIRAVAQESVGNRIVYGNYVDRLGRPEYLGYSIQIDDKFEGANSSSIEITGRSDLRQQYPQASVKQNRTYQVGIVLVDRYGRQSDVILSENDLNSNEIGFTGSTYFHPYRTSGEPLRPNASDIWVGDSIKVLFTNSIPSTYNVSGYAGLYDKTNKTNPTGWYTYKVVVKQPETDYYNAYLPGILNNFAQRDANGWSTSLTPSYPTVTSTKVANIVLIGDNINKIPRELQDVGPEQREFAADVDVFGRVDSSSWGSSTQYYPARQADTVRLIGTYSDLNYDRTNPGVDGGDDAGDSWITFTEKDQNEVATYSPPQKGVIAYSPFFNVPGNTFDVDTTGTDYEAAVPFEQINSTLIAKINTSKTMGILGGVGRTGKKNPWTYDNGLTPPASRANILWYARPPLSVLEIRPTRSDIDIYYETSTSGSIDVLNADVLLGDTWTPQSLQPLNFSYTEGQAPISWVSDSFYPLANGPTQINNAQSQCILLETKDGNGTIVDLFEVIKDTNNNSFRMRIKNGVYIYFGENSPVVNNYTFTFLVTNINPNTSVLVTNQITINPDNLLTNVAPGWVDNGGSLGAGIAAPSTGGAYYGAGNDWPYAPWEGDNANNPAPPPSGSIFEGTNPGQLFDTANNRALYTGDYNDPIKSNPVIGFSSTTEWLPLVALNGFNGSYGTGLGTTTQLMKEELVWTVEDIEFWWTGRLNGVEESEPAWQSLIGMTSSQYQGNLKNSVVIEVPTGVGFGIPAQAGYFPSYFSNGSSNMATAAVTYPGFSTITSSTLSTLVRLADFGTDGYGPNGQFNPANGGDGRTTIRQAYAGKAETLCHKLRGLAHWYSDLDNVYAAYPAATNMINANTGNMVTQADMNNAMFAFSYKASPYNNGTPMTFQNVMPQYVREPINFGSYNYNRFIYNAASTWFPAVKETGTYGSTTTQRATLGNYTQGATSPPAPAPGSGVLNDTLYRIKVKLSDANGNVVGDTNDLYVSFIVSNTNFEPTYASGGNTTVQIPT